MNRFIRNLSGSRKSIICLILFLTVIALPFSIARANTNQPDEPVLKKAFVLSSGGPIHWHESVPKGTEIMQDFALGNNPDNHEFEVFVTNTSIDITAENLADCDVFVINNTTGLGRLLGDSQKQVLEDFVNAGGGVAGWHGATDIGEVSDYPWYGNWLSADFTGTGNWVPARMNRTAESYSGNWDYITDHWAAEFNMILEEWYEYENPSPEESSENTIILTLNPGDVGSSQTILPMAWVNESKSGRLFMTALGHLDAVLARTDVQDLIYKGIVYAAGGYGLVGCMDNTATNYDPDAVNPCTNCCIISPTNLAYSKGTTLTYTQHQAIAPNFLTYHGTPATNVTVSPALPAGLQISDITGTLSGTPTQVSPATDYTVTVTNPGGTANITINIEVQGNPTPPTGLAYSMGTSLTYKANQQIAPNNLSYQGETATSITLSKPLPAGLQFNSSDGTLSGTPTEPIAPDTYTVTVTNQYGSGNIVLNISVQPPDLPPFNLSYTDGPTVTYEINKSITPNILSFDGAVATSLSVSPGLPAGLNFNTASGTITGTPTQLTAAGNYIVTVTNSAGSADITLSIEIVPLVLPPSNLLYSEGTILNYSLNTPITENILTYDGDPATRIYVSPSLPAGLLLDSLTGNISGTPTEVTPAANHIISVSNSAGIANLGMFLAVIIPASISSRDGVPDSFDLKTTLNPLNRVATIWFAIPEAGNVSLDVYNLIGDKLKTVADGYYKAGHHSVTFNALSENESQPGQGLFLINMQAGDFNDALKVFLE